MHENLIPQSKLSKEAFIFGDDALLKLKSKIEQVGTPLKEWDIAIYRGVLTGYNEAFIIDTQTKEMILNSCKDESERERTAKLIKPILRGRDIKRYSYEWANLWLINTHNGYTSQNGEQIPAIDINDYPALKKHLDSFYPKLEKRADKGKTPYNLRNCAYLEDFEKEKIVYSEIVREPQFYLDEDKFYAEATSFVLTGENLKYLIALLNSKFISFVFKTFYAGGGLGGEGYRYKKKFLEHLPVPKITKENQNLADELVNLVDTILVIKSCHTEASAEVSQNINNRDISLNAQYDKDTSELQSQIDNLVFKLYNLNEAEIKLIKA